MDIHMDLQKLADALQYAEKAGREAGGLFGAAGIFHEGRNPEKWQEIKNSPYYRELLEEVYSEGKRYLKEPIRTLTYSLYRIFDDTGSRKEYEKEYFERRGRLNTFAILSMVDENPKFIEALEDTIWAICDEYTWCLPAHLRGRSTNVISSINDPDQEDGKIRKHVWEHRNTVDLFAAETGFALSEILSMLERRLAPLVVRRARQEIRERILEPYCELGLPFWWENCTNNWAAVCAGSVGAAAMYLIEDTETLTPILYRLLGTMDCFLSGYKEDGACTEGLSYWNYGFGFFVYFAELLRQRTGGKIDLMQSKKIKEIAQFQQKCYLSENHVVSFSDASRESRYSAGLTHYLKSRFPEVEIPDSRYRAGFTDDHCYRWAASVRDFVWSNHEYRATELQEKTYYLQDSEWLISRKLEREGRKGSRFICFAAKGGHNDEPHNHNDVGNFMLHVGGETLLTDTGCGEYTKQYFGPQRYSIFCNGSQGHSVPVIEGRYQVKGREYSARILDVSMGADKDLLALDITKAYDHPNLVSLVRRFDFYKSGPVKLVLRDEYVFKELPSSLVERFVSFYRPVLVQEGLVRLQGERNHVDIAYDPRVLEFGLETARFTDHDAEEMDVYVINLHGKAPQVKESVEITFSF